MLTFDEAMTLTRTVSSHAAFEDREAEAYFEVLMTLAPGSTIVEVGLEYGRSSSIALQVAKELRLAYIGIDPFVTYTDTKQKWLELAMSVLVDSFRLETCQSQFVSILQPISAILIDGDHSQDAVRDDLEHFAPLIAGGGYLMMHDYGRDSLPEVYAAATTFFDKHPEFVHLRTVGSLGIWRRND